MSEGRTTTPLTSAGSPQDETRRDPQVNGQACATTAGSEAAGPKGPLRTCVGCRKVDDKARLRRVVVDDAGRLLPQRGRRPLTGRGAYVHLQEKCLIAALTRGGFDRAFRRKVVFPKDNSPQQFLFGLGRSEERTRPETDRRSGQRPLPAGKNQENQGWHSGNEDQEYDS